MRLVDSLLKFVMGLFFFSFLLIVALDGYRIRRPVGSCSVTYLVPYFQVTSPVLVSPYEIYVAYRGVSWESTFHLSRVMCVWFSLLSWWWWFSLQVVSNSCDATDCSLPDSCVPGISLGKIISLLNILPYAPKVQPNPSLSNKRDRKSDTVAPIP